MKLECSVEKIKNAVLGTERIASKNLSLPILSSILCIASGRSLKLRATNLSLGIEIEVPAKIEKEGVIAIEATVFLNAINNISNENTVFFEADKNLLIKTKKNNLTIKAQAYEDFPTIPVITGEKYILPAKKFTEGLKAVYYSAALSDIKPEISSVYVYNDEEHLVFVATDSFRLAEKKIKVKNSAAFPPVIIPTKNINEILKILENVTEDITISFSKNQISITYNGVYLTSRVVDGSFPDYKLIIPKEIKTEAVLLKQELLTALKLSNVFSDKFNQVTFLVSPKTKVFEVQAENNDVGRTVSTLDAAVTGEDITLNLNHKYITDCLQSIPEDSVSVSFAGEGKPVVIRGVSDKSFLYLVMPMNR